MLKNNHPSRQERTCIFMFGTNHTIIDNTFKIPIVLFIIKVRLESAIQTSTVMAGYRFICNVGIGTYYYEGITINHYI